MANLSAGNIPSALIPDWISKIVKDVMNAVLEDLQMQEITLEQYISNQIHLHDDFISQLQNQTLSYEDSVSQAYPQDQDPVSSACQQNSEHASCQQQSQPNSLPAQSSQQTTQQ